MDNVLPFKGIYPRLGKEIYIAPGAWIIGDVVMGDRSSVWFNTVVRGDVNYIRIGDDTSIQDNSTLHVMQETFPLVLGDRVTVGHGVILHGAVIGNDCLIGMGAIILDGCKIGDGSIVAAGTLLPPGFEAPPGSLVMGSPPVAKEASPKHQAAQKQSVKDYREVADEYLHAEAVRKTRIKGFLG